MTLKTLGKTTWDEIEVGEVFAINGCWIVAEKISSHDLMYLYDTEKIFHGGRTDDFIWDDLYKLPLSTQRLWRQDT